MLLPGQPQSEGTGLIPSVARPHPPRRKRCGRVPGADPLARRQRPRVSRLADPHAEPGQEVEPPSPNQAHPGGSIRAQAVLRLLEWDDLRPKQLPECSTDLCRFGHAAGQTLRLAAGFQTHIVKARSHVYRLGYSRSLCPARRHCSLGGPE
jgi:hypothetical protein